MAVSAASEGVSAVAATPHVRPDYPTTPAEMRRAVEELQRGLVEAGVDLRVLPGAEVSVEAALTLPAAELAHFGLAGNPGYVLLETPYVGWPLMLPDLVAELASSGIRPVLAHPERNRSVQQRPEGMGELVARGALIQLTAGSLTGASDGPTRRAATQLLDLELVHLLASDRHRAATRRASLAQAVGLLEPRLADWLSRELPQAIVEGAELPPRPSRRRRGRRLRPDG
jgi:protein-tyrosine phosphatase